MVDLNTFYSTNYKCLKHKMMQAITIEQKLFLVLVYLFKLSDLSLIALQWLIKISVTNIIKNKLEHS